MRWIPLLAMALLLVPPCLAEAPLGQLSLDDAAAIGLRLSADEAVKVEGESSLRIETDWPVTINLGAIQQPKLDGGKIVYRAKVRSKLEEGQAHLEMWAHLKGQQYFSRGLQDPITGESDWQTLEAPFFFEDGQVPDKLTLNLVVQGRGTVWIDDIVVRRVER